MPVTMYYRTDLYFYNMNLSDSPYFTVYDEFNYGKDVYFYHYDLYGEDGIKLKSKGYDIPVPGAYGCLLALIGIR